MSEAYPDRPIELDLYEPDIVDMANHYPGTGFYEYHKQFSATAAAYLKNHNTKVFLNCYVARDNTSLG